MNSLLFDLEIKNPIIPTPWTRSSSFSLIFLGLGVDDMFVIVQAMDCVERQVVAKQPVHVQIAYAMRSAGVSITVTSLTDILAFGVGTTTVSRKLKMNL